MNPDRCKKCGTTLATSGPVRLCPACLLQEALALADAVESAEDLPRPFGDYELLSEIGRGGMGVVYRARQGSLDRLVALKVPSDNAFADAGMRQRFKTEAAAAARLRHPQIVAIHDYGEVDGRPFYVMDLVAGRDLAALCGGRPLEPQRAATILRKLAQAVHYAHLAGVVHRDLKPTNVVIDEADEPRITDFGLAKRLELPEGATVAGQMLGSPGYASPEQVAGRTEDVGVPSDIYSLGALGYHLATGGAPFRGATASEVMRAMLAGVVSAPRARNPALPRDLEAIILTCLEADPARRYPSAAALATDLERFLAARPVTAALARRRAAWVARMTQVAPWAALALVGGFVVGFVFFREAPAPDRSVVHATIDLPADAPLAPSRAMPLGSRSTALALSPDGRSLVYVALVGATTQLQLRALGSDTARPIAGTEGGYLPAFAPDGRRIAFLTATKLRSISTEGGTAMDICDVSDDSFGVVWAADGRIYVSSGGGLWRVAASGGLAERVDGSELDRGITAAPRGEGVFGCTRLPHGGSGDHREIRKLDTASGEVIDLGVRGHSARLLPDGSLIFARGDNLFGARRGADGSWHGADAVPVLSGLQADGMQIMAQYAVSETGMLVYAAGGALDRARLVWVDRSGQSRPLAVPAQSFGTFELSPDGRRLAVLVAEESTRALVIELETGNTRIIPDPVGLSGISWSPDGSRLLLAGWRDGHRGLFAAAIDDIGRPARELYRAPDDATTITLRSRVFHEASAWIVVSRKGGVTEHLRVRIDVSDAPAMEPVPATPRAFTQFSPDGRWLAFSRRLPVRSEVCVQRVPDGPIIQVSLEGGEEPRWSARGDELYYRYGDAWMVVPVSWAPEFRAGAPRELFRGPYVNVPGFSYAVAPDGDRFLMLQSESPDEPMNRLHLVLNWAVEVEQRLAQAR